MQVQRTDSVSVQHSLEGEERHYHIYEQFEIIEFVIPPGYEQPWHRHAEIWEAFLVTEGEMIAKEGEQEEVVSEGDTFVMTPGETFHTIENRSDEPAHGICFKFHPSEKSTHSLFATDKILKNTQ